MEVIKSNPCIKLVRREALVAQQVAANALWKHLSYQVRNGLIFAVNGEVIGWGVTFVDDFQEFGSATEFYQCL